MQTKQTCFVVLNKRLFKYLDYLVLMNIYLFLNSSVFFKELNKKEVYTFVYLK